jgi:fatty acid-binding protein DegV
VQNWFLEQLVTDFDYVICLTVSSVRSPIFENATQASFGLLQNYRERRAAAGINGPFALRVVDSQTVFAGLAVLAAEGVRLLAEDQHPNAIRTRLEQLSEQMNTFRWPTTSATFAAAVSRRATAAASAIVCAAPSSASARCST